MAVRAISYGGGVQSTALLVLAAQGEIDFPLAIFANTGEDSENPATLTYVNDIARPYAEANGVDLIEVRKAEGLYANLMRLERSMHIPARGDGGAPGRRGCTYGWKRLPVAREMKRRGATADNPGVLALGISMDEFGRMRSDTGFTHYTGAYPLIDRRMDRQDCLNLIARAGLPQPEKSRCFFCPFQTLREWDHLRVTKPDLFAKSVELERVKNEQRLTMLDKDGVPKRPMWLSAALVPLDEAVKDTGQMSIFDSEMSCNVAGYCGA